MQWWLGLWDEVFGDLVGGRDLETAGGGDDLVFGPRVSEIIEPTPEGRDLPLDLEHRATDKG